MNDLYEKIRSGENLRANLIELKQLLKDGQMRRQFGEICGENYDPLMKCLVDGDPKVRKNAAAILGTLKAQSALDVLYDAWEAEETLFVRPAYVAAMAGLDCGKYVPQFKKRLDELITQGAPEDEKKHILEEAAALRKLLLDKEGIEKHHFTGYSRTNPVILTTLPAFREILAADIPFQKTLLKSGVKTTVGDMNTILENRYWQEMLFVVDCGDGDGTLGHVSDPTDDFANKLSSTDLMEVLNGNHRGRPPYYYRVGVTGQLTREERSFLIKRMAPAIERAFGGALINSPSHYEVEIRLSVDGESRITPYLKFFTISDNRFAYNRQHVAAGMKPFVAAGIIGLSKPYLTDYAQVLDPFCGTGTLITERRFAGPVRSAYGTDTFGEAIEKARMNAAVTGMPTNYINRDFFDFTHDYLFDEIVTDMPDRIGDREETNAFYADFLAKSADMLSEHGRIFAYTPEGNLMRKHLRLNGRFKLLREFSILEKAGTYLFILEKK